MAKLKTKKGRILKAILIVLCVSLSLYIVLSFFLINHYMNEFFGRAVPRKYTGFLRYSDIEDECPRYEISFLSGENTLRGYVYGENTDKGLVVLSHGIGGGAEDYTDIIGYFVKKGWLVLGFDNTGSYGSDGDGTVGMAQSVLDLDAALTFCENDSRLKDLPKVLIGHSWGGYAAGAVLNFDHDVKAAVSFAGYNKPIDILFEFSGNFLGGFAPFEYPFIWLYNKMKFGNNSDYTAVDGINKSDIPVMIIHGTNDKTVSPTGAGIIAHKNEITNPNVVYVRRDDEYNNGHNSLFYTEERSKYAGEKNKLYDELSDKYDGEIPESELKKFYEGVDRRMASQLDEALFDSIELFYIEAIK